MYTDLINQCLRDEKDKLQVFDKSGPYLPTKKVGKNNPKTKEIEADNEMRREWNQTVDQVLIAGGTQKDVVEFKQKYVTDQVAHSIEVNGQDPEVFVYILYQAIDILKQFLHFLMVMGSKRGERIKANETGPHREQLEVEEKISFDPLELQKAQAEYLKMKSHHDAHSSINNKYRKSCLLMEICDILHVYDNTNSKPVRIVRKHKDDITIYPNKDWSEAALLSLING